MKKIIPVLCGAIAVALAGCHSGGSDFSHMNRADQEKAMSQPGDPKVAAEMAKKYGGAGAAPQAPATTPPPK